MDLNWQQNADSKNQKFYPVPQSHWFPRPIAFKAFTSTGAESQQKAGLKEAGRLHIQVSGSLLVRLTKDIVETYAVSDPKFQYSESCNPKRYFTVPSVGVSNNGSDNENHDLILYYGRVLADEDKLRRYVVKDIVGCGTFGQVAKCFVQETNEFVAVKVIKNQRAYSTQAKVEIGILHRLNNVRDWRNEHHVVRSFDHFSCEGHLCIVFELLGVNLFELLKTNGWKGISLQLLRIFTGQLLDALSLLHDARVIHCDLKPENILLSSLRGAEIKLIDFGSACMEEQTVYSYIQSRFYRSPEVVLGHPYSTAIDMWSLGCVAAELFLGLPIFPGQCPYDLLRFIIEKLGKQPPDYILRNAKNTNKYFKRISAAPQPENGHTGGYASVYQFLTPDENESRERKKPEIGKRYMSGSLEQMIMTYPTKPCGQEETEIEMFNRRVFIDFLRGLIEVDPVKRWTPHEASQHPFLTEGPFTGPYRPRSEGITRAPTTVALTMEHKGSSGHWLCGGLSPNVGKMNSTIQLNLDQQFQPLPLNIAGSPASFGSFADCGALGSSLGSIGEGALSFMSMPPGLNGHSSLGAGSPDVRWHYPQPKQSAGYTQLGMSSSASGMRPMSLGVSPSHPFHVSAPHMHPSPGSQHISSPGSQFLASPGILCQGSPISTFQMSPGSSSRCLGSPSQGSPRYGPHSPAYAAMDFNKRRNPGLGPVPPPSNASGGVAYENVLLARVHQNNAAGIAGVGNGIFAHVPVGSYAGPQWRASRAGGTMGMIDQQQLSNAFLTGTLGSQLFISETTTEVGDEETPASKDSDGEFREELLFDHDPVTETTVFPAPMELGPSGQGSGASKKSNQGSYGVHGRGQTSKHCSAAFSRLGHGHHKQALVQNQQKYASYSHSPQQSFASGSQSGNSSGPPSRRFPSGECNSHSSPAGVLQFQQRQHQQNLPHHFPDHQQSSASSFARSGKKAEMGKPIGDGLLPFPQMNARSFHAAHTNNGRFVGLGNSGYTGAGIIPDGRGLPMATGLGQQNFLGVGVPSCPAQDPLFPPGQIYATDQFFAGRKAGPSLVRLNKPPSTGKGAYRIQK